MATALIWDDKKIEEIKTALAQASANVIPWSAVQESAVASKSDTLLLSERNPNAPDRPASISVEFDGGVRVAISFEEQPAGVFRHMSVGTGKKGQQRLPHPIMVAKLCELFGFTSFPPEIGRVWVEEYDPDYFAINVIELVQQHEAGHA